MLFNKMTATTGFYLHPYFCFRKYANSNNGFTCGCDVGPVATVNAVAEVLHQPHVPEVIAVVGVPATVITTEVVAVTDVPELLEVLMFLQFLLSQLETQYNITSMGFSNIGFQIGIAKS